MKKDYKIKEQLSEGFWALVFGTMAMITVMNDNFEGSMSEGYIAFLCGIIVSLLLSVNRKLRNSIKTENFDKNK